jgi:Domain of unknown function (DUF4386)
MRVGRGPCLLSRLWQGHSASLSCRRRCSSRTIWRGPRTGWPVRWESFGASFAAYLIEATCDITLNVLLYALIRPVSRNLALLAACFGLIGTAVFAGGEMLYFSAALPALNSDVGRVISTEDKAMLS